jgi:hypothetical protein
MVLLAILLAAPRARAEGAGEAAGSGDKLLEVVAAGVFGALLGGWTERRKARIEFQAKVTEGIRQKRLRSLAEATAHLECLALYFPRSVTYAGLYRLGRKLRSWYFKRGGLFLTEETKRAYFALQWALELTVEAASDHLQQDLLQRDGTVSFLHPAHAVEDEAKYRFFRAGDPMPSDVESTEDHYRFVRALGSMFRTAITRDLESRLQSSL